MAVLRSSILPWLLALATASAPASAPAGPRQPESRVANEAANEAARRSSQDVAAPAPARATLQNTSWTRKDGAPANVFSMAQDGNGLLWFAATDGLYSFDGARFLRQRAVYGHPLHAQATTAVTAVGETIWVGYQFGGISRFEHGAVRHYTGKNGPQGAIYHFIQLPDGSLWATGSRGLHRFDGEDWRLVTPADGLSEGLVMFHTVLPDGSMLVYAPDGIYRSARKAGSGGYTFTRVLDEPGVDGGDLWKDGQVLINSRAHGLRLFDPASGRLAPFQLRNGGLPMHTYTVDHRGRLWVNTGDALQLLDEARRPLQQFMPANGFSGKTMTTALTDREGNLWFATENGVDRVREPRLATIALPTGLTGPPGVVAGDDGAVWVINFHHENAFRVPTFIVDADGTRRDTGIHRVSATHSQADGTLWFAGDGGLWRVRKGETTRVALPGELAGRTVQAITTGPDGDLWLSVVGKGIHALRRGAWSAGGGHPELAMPTAISLSADRAGRIWLGYPDNRIAMLENGVVRQFDGKDGLAVGNTLAMVQGRDRFWIGGDRGLAWFDGKRFAALGERGRGSFYGVSGIVERGNGELWLHDTSGLARLDAPALAAAAGQRLPDVAAERFDHLDGHRGMPAQIRPLPSLVQATDGRLWYATSSSVGYIDPAAIPRNPRPPTVLIGAVRTDERAYPAGAALALPARVPRLEIDFTATALSMPERVRFRYRLVGQDGAWRDAGGLRQAVYTNLAPGAYTFEVIAANEDGVWSPRPASVALSIEAAFTQTLWFKLACALAAVAAIWLLHRWRLARVAARLHNDLKVRMLERERIARTLHDTFLQSVQSLVLRMHVLMHKLPDQSAVRAEAEEVLARAERVMDEGRDRVRQLRGPAVREGSLAQALTEAGREFAASGGTGFVAQVDGRPPELAPEVEDELFTIGREALANAFRHAAAAKVALQLDYRGGMLRLAVIDDGCGIPRDILARGARAGHWGLPGMRERAHLAGASLEIDSTPRGTTVRVTMPLAAGTPARDLHTA
ncbi:sensor histidine kinase [Pseudoduganella albidiflava]|nr:sensor histidine kinase [Pseudoduganella albidiflava]QBI02301.1 hypothetical protein EYF70_16730 [Pseudoduganella albidiflava]